MIVKPSILLLDASCLLNLYATGRLCDIIAASRYQFGVADYVLREEALYTRRPISGEGREERVPIDLSPLVDASALSVLSLEHQAEEDTFVDLATEMDDGESITGALAFHRRCAVATDDRKARRVLSERAPGVPLVSTLELLKEWAEADPVPLPEVKEAVVAMQTGASYVPGERDPLYNWWIAVMDDSESA